MGLTSTSTGKICVCVGTRPDLIKLAPIISEIKTRGTNMVLVHTGQHYDTSMSDSFIEELHLPPIDYNLKVKESFQGRQTALIMARFEQVLMEEGPEIVIVLGDTNSAMACALAAAKNGVKVAHIEAGCRSGDKMQQEEINRVVIDHVATLNLAATLGCYNNLSHEGLGVFRSTITGHPIVDLLHRVKDKIFMSNDLPFKGYALLTLHRVENINNKEKLRDIIRALGDLRIFVVWPMHPHTRKRIKSFELEKWINHDCTRVIESVSYVESLSLIKNAMFVMTDSGGIQQEAALLGTPCFTLRDRTEWPETIEAGVNTLIDSNVRLIHDHMRIHRTQPSLDADVFGKVGASKRIVDLIMSLLRPQETQSEPQTIKQV